MNKEQIIYQLERLLDKVNDCKGNLMFKPEFTSTECQALQYAINFMKNEKNDVNNIDKIKQDYEKKLKEEIQEYCDHIWGEDHWTCDCGVYHRCENVVKLRNSMNVIDYE